MDRLCKTFLRLIGKEGIVDTDFLIIRKMKQGDEAAFDSFVRKYYSDMLKYCRFHSKDQREAEDLTQETFVRFFAKLSEYRYQGKTKNYLYTIAANLCRNQWKKQEPLPTEDDALADALTTSDQEETATTHLLLEWALGQLPPEQREVILLHYYQGLKLREIADILEIGLPLVKYRLRQAKARLYELIGKEALIDDP